MADTLSLAGDQPRVDICAVCRPHEFLFCGFSSLSDAISVFDLPPSGWQDKRMKALVTGATGFVGSHLTRLLIERGFRARVLYRSEKKLRILDGLEVEAIAGELDDINLTLKQPAPIAMSSSMSPPKPIIGKTTTATRSGASMSTGRAIC